MSRITQKIKAKKQKKSNRLSLVQPPPTQFLFPPGPQVDAGTINIRGPNGQLLGQVFTFNNGLQWDEYWVKMDPTFGANTSMELVHIANPSGLTWTEIVADLKVKNPNTHMTFKYAKVSYQYVTPPPVSAANQPANTTVYELDVLNSFAAGSFVRGGLYRIVINADQWRDCWRLWSSYVVPTGGPVASGGTTTLVNPLVPASSNVVNFLNKHKTRGGSYVDVTYTWAPLP